MLKTLAFLFLLATPSFAANVCVNKTASGANTGTSWTDALTDAPAGAAITRGDTIYFAGGAYGAWTVDKAASGSTLITIKKATVADHGCSTGWSDSFASTPAVFTNISFLTSHWLMDGQTGGGPSTWTTGSVSANFGIDFSEDESSCTPQGVCCTSARLPTWVQIGSTAAVSDITLKHFSAHSVTNGDCDPYACYPGGGFNMATGQALDSITISDFAFYKTFTATFNIGETSNFSIERGYIGHNRVAATTDSFGKCDNEHGEVISFHGTNDLITAKNLLIDDFEGTAVFACTNNSSGADHFNIFGNLIINSAHPVDSGAGCPTPHLMFANNTVAYSKTIGGTGGIYSSGCIPGCIGQTIQNNIWYHSDADDFALYGYVETYNYASFLFRSTGTGCTGWIVSSCDLNSDVAPGPQSDGNSQNAGGANPFVSPNLDPLIADFHLSANTSPGITLLSPYDADAFGVTRGANGSWNMGAYQIPASAAAGTTSVNIRARTR